jgi:hypothetical protein
MATPGHTVLGIAGTTHTQRSRTTCPPIGSVAGGPELLHDICLDAPAGVDLDALPGRPRAHRGGSYPA